MVEIRDFVGEEIVGGKTFVTVTVKEEADETAFRTIAFSKPAFIIPMALSEENGEQIFSYDVTAERFIRASMLPNAMSPIEFLTFMKNMTKSFVECDDYFMNPLNLLILEDYIYVNPRNYDVRLIYVPFCEPVFSEANISSNIFRISRRFSKTAGDGWQEIITRLWNLSESTSVYEASELFGALCDEHNASEQAEEEAPRVRAAHSTEWRAKPNDAFIEPEQAFVRPQEASAGTPILREPETEKKKKGLFGLGEKSDKKDSKKEQPKKAEKGGMFSSRMNDDRPAAMPKEEGPKPVKEQKSFFGGGHKAEQPQKPVAPSWSQSNVNDDVTQPPPGVYGQHSDDTTQPPPGYLDISSARFDFCGGKNLQNLPETIRVELKDGVFIIGRVKNGKNACDFAFPEATGGVSHLHARIIEREGHYFIIDMNTRYGTYVGFHKIAPMKEVELIDGEKVSFSTGVDYEFRIEKGR